MLETLTIITLATLFLIFFRPGKTPPLDNPLVIERPGQYHITLSPLLNLAQPFIEAVAKQLATSGETAPDSATQCFEVYDKQATAHGHGFYLLAITRRNGLLYFQATSPSDGDPGERHKTISGFADTVLKRFPATEERGTMADERIIAATQKTAQLRGIQIKPLG